MDEETADFRACYLHPGRPAIRNCINCERPICAFCEEESGDPLLCLPCMEELESIEHTSLAHKVTKVKAPPRRTSAFDVGDVTIHADGSVEAPEPEEAGPEKPEEAPGEEPEETVAAARREPAEEALDEAGVGGAAPGRVKKPVPRPTETPPTGKLAAVTHVLTRQEEPERRSAKARPPAQRGAKKRKPAREREPRTGPLAQAVWAFPAGIVAALGVSAVWLAFAFFANQWSQVTVFSLGIVVPWALYKGSTTRKYKGKPLWEGPPAPLWLAVPSFVIVTATAIPLQLAAYKLIYRSNPAKLPFSDFMERFFTTFNWVLFGAGLALSFVVPYLLVHGHAWRRPSRARLREARDDEEDEEVTADLD